MRSRSDVRQAMNFESDLTSALTKLAEGEFTAEEWLEWWRENGDRTATILKRTQWLRLKPQTPGSWGPPCRSALVSHAQACNLLRDWGIAFTASTRYKQEWNAYFEQYSREQAAKRKEQQKQFTATFNSLGANFPQFSAYLKRRKKDVERIDAGLSASELRDWENDHRIELPLAYKLFLRCCKTVVIGDDLKIGLEYTFVSKGTEFIPKDSICFGDWFLESDGDQLYFFQSDQGHEVHYYSHGVPEFRKVADSFLEWVEGCPWREKSK